MGYAALGEKLAHCRANRHLILEAVRQNNEASFLVEYTHNSTAIEGNTLSLTHISPAPGIRKARSV